MALRQVARQLLIGCAIGFVAIVVWLIAEKKEVPAPPAEASLPLVEAPTAGPVRPLSANRANDNLGSSEKESEIDGPEVAAVVALDEHAPSTPYEIIMADRSEQSAATIMFFRNKILSSEDEPQWTRPIERELFAFITQLPESDSTIVESITCRSAGCEVQSSHDPETQANNRWLLGLEKEFPSLQPSLDTGEVLGGRLYQLTFFTRVEQEGE